MCTVLNVSVIQLPLVGVPFRAGLHAAVVVSPAPTSFSKRSGALVIDFLPRRPTSPFTALQLLSGAGTPGLQRCQRRHLAAGRRKAYAGQVRGALSSTTMHGCADDEFLLSHLEDVVRNWQRTNGWQDLRLGSRDCRAYARAVVSFLCDEV